jgi:hypothetical protein
MAAPAWAAPSDSAFQVRVPPNSGVQVDAPQAARG